MNRQILYYLGITAIAVSAIIILCNKSDNSNEKLVEILPYDWGTYKKIKYDRHNRISKMSEYNKKGELLYLETFTYNGNDLLKIVDEDIKNPECNSTVEFTKKENIITAKKTFGEIVIMSAYFLNSEGLLVKYVDEKVNVSSEIKYRNGILINASSVVNFEYQDGNLVKVTEKLTWSENEVYEDSTEYKYDYNKSPFYHCKTPKWFLIVCFERFGVQNNVIEEKKRNFVYKIKYIYDSDGYPITRIGEPDIDADVDLDLYMTEFKYKKVR